MAATPLRDIPDDVLAHYTRQAAREGISRNALLVRVLSVDPEVPHPTLANASSTPRGTARRFRICRR